MNILVIQGPNLNLLGKKSAAIGKRITLDKVNKALRLLVRNRDVHLKIFQSHHLEKAVTVIQRQRNWAHGIVLAPSSWARYEWTLKETLTLINLPVVEVFFRADFSFGTTAKESILKDVCVQTIESDPIDAFSLAVEYLIKHAV